jgi:hypothetical protein
LLRKLEGKRSYVVAEKIEQIPHLHQSTLDHKAADHKEVQV